MLLYLYNQKLLPIQKIHFMHVMKTIVFTLQD